jgi:colanic acid/amylovoran biosynthesis glycosyltransferase
LQHKKLNICLVTNDFPALTETFITTKALELAGRGHSITVISNRVGGPLNSSHVADVNKAGIEILYFPAVSSPKQIGTTILANPFIFARAFFKRTSTLKKNFKTALQVKLLQQKSFDIIHFEFSGLATGYLHALKNIEAKIVVSCRGTAEKVKPLTVPGRTEALKKLFSRADSIHCVSQDMANTILPMLSTGNKIFVNRPSIDATVFKRDVIYPGNHFQLQILSIGRFTFQKGYYHGLIAIQALRRQGISFTWKIVGDGPLKEEIIYHLHTLGLTDCVKLLGKKNRDEILALYQTADIFLLPSIYEGIANVCLEAMAMELPVIATRSGGMEEVIEHGVNGLLCDVYEPGSITEQIVLLANDTEKRKEMGRQARKYLLENLTIQKQADMFEAEYEKLVNNNAL